MIRLSGFCPSSTYLFESVSNPQIPVLHLANVSRPEPTVVKRLLCRHLVVDITPMFDIYQHYYSLSRKYHEIHTSLLAVRESIARLLRPELHPLVSLGGRVSVPYGF